MNPNAEDIHVMPAPSTPGAGANGLLQEIAAFRTDCERRYNFNNRWDIVLSVVGILLSIAVVAAGFIKRPEISAVLGAVVGAVVTAQKAFPFGQRSSFYRLLVGQADNLITRTKQNLLTTKEAVDLLSTLRMDFAQQLPRGSGSRSEDSPAPPQGPKDAPAA